MKLPDILSAFHKMPTCDRLDLICRLLRDCVPYELRFLGTVILDAAHAQMKSFSATEVVANQVNHYSGFKDSGGLTHTVCEKLCCALAVVDAQNHPVAEAVFSLLDNPQVLQLFEETADVKVLDDFRLLYVMAVNHPALSFNQRQHLLYMYLQRMDAFYTEKCKSALSMERSGEGESTLRREPGKDAYITYCDVHSVYKRQPDKRYAYMIQVDWSDGASSCVRRTYGDFFSFHTKLLDLFPEEGGQKHKKERMIPYLPGKSYPRILTNRNSRDLAEKRLPELHRYTKELMSLMERISRCDHVLDFFRPKPEDLKEDYPSKQKVTTLYDLLESGKARVRNYAELGKNPPSQSPRASHASPFHRVPPDGPSASSQSRTAHTLPHQSTSSSITQAKEEAGLERRFTYPSRKSAFTPVQPPQQRQTSPSSTHLTNSQPDVANGGSTAAATETAVMATVTTTHSTVTTHNPITPSHSTSTSSPITSHTPSQPPPPPSQSVGTSSTISIISSSHPHIPTNITSNYPHSHVARPMPTYAYSHVHHPPVTSSPPPIHSGKTTPIGEVSYTIPSQFVPIIPPTVPLPLIIGYGSPVPSPSPSPLTPGARGKSSSYIARTPTDFESLSRWLKSHRLHKYASIFENMTFEELLLMDKAALKKKGMTEGAANKLLGKIEELKSQNFTGFRDMPYHSRMHRKPSTCSLPTALLAERGVTPCSSVDGLSPTDSTCSLDKGATLVTQTKSDSYYPSNGSASQETPSVASYDMAILKAVTAPSTVGTHSDAILKSSVTSPSHSITSPSPPPHRHPHTLSPPSASDVQSEPSTATVATLTRSNAGLMSSSWADQLDEADSDRDANTPDWAQLPSDRGRGRSHTPSLTPQHTHAPLNKRHSLEPHDGRSHSNEVPHTRPQNYPPLHTQRNMGPAPPNWGSRQPVLAQNSYPGGRSGGRHRAPHSTTPITVNGLVQTSSVTAVLQRPAGYVPGTGPIPGFPPTFTNHSRGSHQPPPPACFNCGKKGHYGTACPAPTMETSNSEMFHKLAATRPSPNTHRHT